MTDQKGDETDFLCCKSEYCNCDHSWVFLQIFSSEIKPYSLKMEVWSIKNFRKLTWVKTWISKKWFCYKYTLLYKRELLALMNVYLYELCICK